MAETRPVRRLDRAQPGGSATRSRGGPRKANAATRRARVSPVPWSRRVGVAVGLLAVTGTIALAGSGVLTPTSGPDRPGPSGDESPDASTPGSVTPLLAPTIQGPATALTRGETWAIQVELGEGLSPRSSVRVYREDRPVAEARIRDQPLIEVADVPLRRGENALSATLVGPLGESGRSAVVVVTRDDVPPDLTVDEPVPNAVINAAEVLVRGNAEPGAVISLANAANQASVQVSSASDGAFEAAIGLVTGANPLSVRATDTAGNEATSNLLVTRGEGQPEVRLDLSASVFNVRRLPASISLRVLVVDADGIAVDGAGVVFSISPPGQPTSTYRTLVVRGEASWLNVTLPQDGATEGEGFATAQVTLADGSTVRAIEPFEFR